MQVIAGILTKSAEELELFNKSINNSLKSYCNGQISSINSENVILYNLISCENISYALIEDVEFILSYNARIDNNIELAHKLGLDKSDTTSIIKVAYKLWGLSMGKYLRGDYSIIIYSKVNNTLFIVRDAIGIIPVFFFKTNSSIVFSTIPSPITELAYFNKTIDTNFLYDLLITVKSTPEKTYYKALQKLSPGHFLFHKNDDLIIKNYYIPTIKSTPKIHTFEEATELMREKLRNAVKRRINNSSNVACELSGGIDSTAVCAISIEYNSAITGLSHAMNDATKLFFPYTDEKELINDFLDYSHLKKHHFVAPVEEGILDVIQESISWMAYPQQFSYQWFSDILYKKAQLEGASTLLSGFGGDEGVSMHRSAMSEMLLQNMNYIDFIQFEKIRSQTSSSKATIRLIKQLLKQFLEQQFLYKKFQKQNFSLNNLSINLNELNQTEISNRYDQYKYRKKGYPDYTQYYCRVFQNHVSTRIDACSVMAGHYGIEYRYPLLDIDLLEFFFSLPICFKVSPTQTRYLYREAIKGYIPDSIRLRNDKSGATIPTVRYRLNKDFKLIESILQNVSGEKAYYVDGNKSIQSMNEILSGASKVTHPSAFYSTLNYLLQP